VRRLLLIVTLAGAASAVPGRHVRYAESTDRLVYAFVFGHKDTCRVIRRPQPPPFGIDGPRRRFRDDWKGGAGEKLLGEFQFGRRGRPLHIAITNDGKHLLAFANRAGPTPPEQDGRWEVATADHLLIAYEELPGFPEPTWPALDRALGEIQPLPKDDSVLSYAFVTREVTAGRLLVGRLSEGGEGVQRELTCFALDVLNSEATPPARGELIELLKESEPLFRAGAARHLGLAKDRKALPELKAALASTTQGAARVSIAAALARCGDKGARKTLRVLLVTEPTAAYELALLKPDVRDAETLAAVLPKLQGRAALHASVALARIGDRAVRALTSLTRAREASVRERVAIVFGHIDTAQAERALLRMVGDADESVRKAAAKALTNPPRAILESNYAEFAKALKAAGKTETKSAAHRLATLAMHAELDDPKVLGALVELTTFSKQASKALRKLTGLKLETSDDWKRWWKER
jgi:HEAT repeat protein